MTEGNAMLATKRPFAEDVITFINGVPVGPLFGGTQPVYQEGILTQGDLVTQTADGVDLNAMWNSFAESTAIYNEAMDHLIEVLTYPVTTPIEPVVQVGDVSFEEATELGVARGAGVPIEVFQMGYDLRHYDKRNAYTWMFLADADQRQLDAIHNEILWADKRLIFKKVMEAIFDNRTRRANIRNHPYQVYPFYNADSEVAPPTFKNNTFATSHNHYVISGGSAVDPSDLEDLHELIAEHGYTPQNGTQFLLLANKSETDVIRQFRRGVTTNGAAATYDFIQSPTQPAMILPNAEGLLGDQPSSIFRGLNVIGSYGFWHIVEEEYIPTGYLVGLGSGGRFALGNPVGMRQHQNPQMQGLRLIAGNNQRYPLIDGFYARSFGTGVRQRGCGAIMQIAASGSYTIPTVYKRGSGFTV